MKPKRIILVRHAESLGNQDKAHYQTVPDFALDLTEVGRKQARAAGEKIAEVIGSESVRAYVSPWYRTRQTFAEISAVLGDRIVRSVEDPRLREQDWGHYQTPDALEKIGEARNQYSTFYFRIPDGESAADVFDRTSTFLETLHRDFAKPDFPENALIVTHGVTLRVFLMRWFHWPPEFYESVRNPKNAEVVVMERGEGGRYVLSEPLRLRESLTDYNVTRARVLCFTARAGGIEVIASYEDSQIAFFREVPGMPSQYLRLASFELNGQQLGSAQAGETAASQIWEEHKGLILAGKGLTLELNEPKGDES